MIDHEEVTRNVLTKYKPHLDSRDMFMCLLMLLILTNKVFQQGPDSTTSQIRLLILLALSLLMRGERY